MGSHLLVWRAPGWKKDRHVFCSTPHRHRSFQASRSSMAAAVQPIHLALPKGHMQEQVFKLFEEAGLKVRSQKRAPRLSAAAARVVRVPRSAPWPLAPTTGPSRPHTRLPAVDPVASVRREAAQGVLDSWRRHCTANVTARRRVHAHRRILPCTRAQPQNILGMLAEGVRDCGFAGADWVNELGVNDSVVEVLDTELDPVRIVAAAPSAHVLETGGRGARVCRLQPMAPPSRADLAAAAAAAARRSTDKLCPPLALPWGAALIFRRKRMDADAGCGARSKRARASAPARRGCRPSRLCRTARRDGLRWLMDRVLRAPAP